MGAAHGSPSPWGPLLAGHCVLSPLPRTHSFWGLDTPAPGPAECPLPWARWHHTYLLNGSPTRRAERLSREPRPCVFAFGRVWDPLPSPPRAPHPCGLSRPPRQAEQRILSRVNSLERRLEALAAEFSSNWQKEALRLERLELRQGATGEGGGGGLSHEDTLALLEGLVSRREAALKEDFHRDTAARIQVGQRSHGLGQSWGSCAGDLVVSVWVPGAGDLIMSVWVQGGPAHPAVKDTALPLGSDLLEVCLLLSAACPHAPAPACGHTGMRGACCSAGRHVGLGQAGMFPRGTAAAGPPGRPGWRSSHPACRGAWPPGCSSVKPSTSLTARQEEVAALRTEHQQDAEDLFKKIVQASQVGGPGAPAACSDLQFSVCSWAQRDTRPHEGPAQTQRQWRVWSPDPFDPSPLGWNAPGRPWEQAGGREGSLASSVRCWV